MPQCISHATRVAPSATSASRTRILIMLFMLFIERYWIKKNSAMLKIICWKIKYLFTPSDDLELQLEGSLRGSRDPLLVTELNDFEDVGPECHPLGVRLLST